MMKTARTRTGIACAAVALVFTVYSARLVHLQVKKHDEYSALAAQKHTMRQVIHARRGLIFDRNGELLASNLPVRTITADGSHIKDPSALAAAVAPILGLDEAELVTKLTTDRKYVVIRRGVPEDQAQAVLAAAQEAGLRGLYSEPDAVRTYPNGQMLGHVLGFLDHDGTGVQGIEMTMEAYLRGKDGYRYIERDRTGREIMLYRGQEEPAENGQNVRLTIDMGLQSIVEEEIETAFQDLKPETAIVLMVDPKTGEILAMASRPCFDPNDPGNAGPEQMKNRAVIDMVEPGSTFKIVVASGALNEGTVNAKSMIFCENGHFAYGGKILRDHHGYGSMSVHDILVKSSNIGSAKMAMMMGEEKFYEYVRRFGFGERSGIELPGEIPGLVHPPHRWDKLTITRMPMGHALAVTPLQITMGMSVIANGGHLMAPQIVRSVEDEDGQTVLDKPPRITREVIPTSTAHFVSDALAEVVGERGTAQLAKVSGFTVAGKTGTAQKVSPTGGYAAGQYVVSFVGYLPAEDPRFVCLVMINNATISSSLNYGGTVAAPIFSRIGEKAARYLNLVPALRAEPIGATPLALGKPIEERAN
ncbi:MAG: peptidoglycan D,D-transpeptidase FtsI family protein [Terrimicrobiaceae bacterium]|jgi:cell division protein FtsI (penicillin-binding protein 3)/stage V sporulation protein D (sporulation-specific penicillin-binding protein)